MKTNLSSWSCESGLSQYESREDTRRHKNRVFDHKWLWGFCRRFGSKLLARKKASFPAERRASEDARWHSAHEACEVKPSLLKGSLDAWSWKQLTDTDWKRVMQLPRGKIRLLQHGMSALRLLSRGEGRTWDFWHATHFGTDWWVYDRLNRPSRTASEPKMRHKECLNLTPAGGFPPAFLFVCRDFEQKTTVVRCHGESPMSSKRPARKQ